MIHSEAFEDGWRLTVSVSDETLSNGERLVIASLSKYFPAPVGYRHDASVSISTFDGHLVLCEKAWERLVQIQQAAEQGLNLSDSFRGLFVWRHGVRMKARGAGKFETDLTLFADQAGYQRHRDLIVRARDRAAELETAIRQLQG